MRNYILQRVARCILHFPHWILTSAAVLTSIAIYLAAFHLPLHTDQDDLVSEDVGYHRRYKEYLREFGDQEYLYCVVEVGHDLPRAKAFVRAFVDRLGTHQEHFREVLYRIDNPAMERSFLLYLSPEQLTNLVAFFRNPTTTPATIRRWNSFADLIGGMNAQIAQISAPSPHPSPAGGEGGVNRASLTMGFTFLDQLLDGMQGALAGPAIPTPRLDQVFLGTDRVVDDEGYFLSSDGRFLFVMIMPRKDYRTLEVIAEPLRLVRGALANARMDMPGVVAGLTGRPVLQADEMTITNRDMARGTIAALVIVAIIFIVYFRHPLRPLLAVGTLAMGICWTYGFASLAIGYLNILSIVFAVILVGAGIEFGLQIAARYREELAAHADVARAVTTCITHTGKGNLTACLTTAAAFFAALGTQFLALRELGLIAGVGILLCLTAMLTVLPAALYLCDRCRHPDRLQTTLGLRLDWLARCYRRPRLVLGIIVLGTIAGLPGLWRLHFDHNLLNLQARGLESVEYELKLMNETDQSTWVTPLVASTREAAEALAERVRALPTVKRVETIAELVPEGQGEKMGVIAAMAKPQTPSPHPSPTKGEGGVIDPVHLHRALTEFAGHIERLMTQAFRAGEVEAVAELEAVAGKVRGIRATLEQADAAATTRLVTYQQAFFADLQRKLRLLIDGLHPTPITLDDVPDALRRRFVSPAGRYVIYAYPKENLWEPAAMAAYIRDLRSIDPHVTGVPVEVYESSRLLEQSFLRVALIAFAAIVLLALLDFRNVRYALLAITPLCAGLLWLLELMGWCDLPFNLANFFAIPILIGVGVDNGIQLIHRYRQEGGTHVSSPPLVGGDQRGGDIVPLMTRSTGTAVLLTSATTFASFITLTFAAHRGIASLGWLMGLGTLTCLVGSMVLLPCLLGISAKRRRKGLSFDQSIR